MRVLWLSSTNTLFDEKGDRAYNGKGWISSLQKTVTEYLPDIQLGVAFLSKRGGGPEIQDNVTYYKIRRNSPAGFRKLVHNWTGLFSESYDSDILRAADDFKPDIVQIFGCETKLASGTVSIKGIPVAVHIQGILNEAMKSFFPGDISGKDFILPGTFINEVLLRNGAIHLREDYASRAEKETKYLAAMRFALGRTLWDRQIVKRYSSAEYFHVDEVLREEFYACAGVWKPRNRNAGSPVRIMSTISNAPYKGLDLIMKCAGILRRGGFPVHWDVVGIRADDPLIKVFSRRYGISCRDSGIRFRGILDPEGIISVMKASDLYVHPSYIENSPNSVCEAQMTGIPVLAAATGGIPSIVTDKETGLLFEPGDAEGLAECIRQISSDADTSARLGCNGAIKAASRHDRKKISADLKAAYIQCMKDYPRI